MSELEDLKQEAFQPGGVDIDRLRVAATLQYRLRNMPPEAMVTSYFEARTADPHGTQELARIGETCERACKGVIRALLEQDRLEARRAA